MRDFTKPLLWVAIVASAMILPGCQKSSPPSSSPAPVAISLPKPKTTADAGVPLARNLDPSRWAKIIADKRYTARKDPFALSYVEAGFEARQESERLLLDQGNFSPLAFEPKDTETEAPVFQEPQPYRRLAGVLVGSTILAIIEMGDGRPAQIVRPGQRIPGTEWTVVSIDQDKAVLRRGGNKAPHEVVVRLESKPYDPNAAATTGVAPSQGQPGSSTGLPPGGQGASPDLGGGGD